MNDNLSNNAIDEKMARMRLKNLEILKRHQVRQLPNNFFFSSV